MAVAWTQVSARFRNDNGSEAAATWKAALNVNLKAGPSLQLRLRICVKCSGTTSGSFTPQLRYSKNAAAYTSVTASSADVRAVDSPNLTDDAATTKQISVNANWSAGKVDDVSGAMTSTAVTTGYDTEMEWSIKLEDSALANGDTLDFRCYNSTTAFGTYSTTLRLTVSKAALTAAMSAFAGAYLRLVAKGLPVSMSALSGGLARQAGRALSAALPVFAAAMAAARLFGKDLAASLSAFAGNAAKLAGKALPASVAAFAGGMARRAGKALAGSTVALAGELARRAGKPLEASLPGPSAALARSTARALAASLSALAGGLTRRAGKALAGSTVALAGELARRAGKPLEASLPGPSAALAQSTARALAGTLAAFAGAISRQIACPLAAGLSDFSAVIGRRAEKLLSGGMAALAALLDAAWTHGGPGQLYYLAVNAAAALFDGRLSKAARKILGSSPAAFAGLISRLPGKTIGAAQALFSARIGRQTARAILSAMNQWSGELARRAAKLLPASPGAFSGRLDTILGKYFAAALYFCGGVSRRIERAIESVLGGFSAGIFARRFLIWAVGWFGPVYSMDAGPLSLSPVLAAGALQIDFGVDANSLESGGSGFDGLTRAFVITVAGLRIEQ